MGGTDKLFRKMIEQVDNGLDVMVVRNMESFDYEVGTGGLGRTGAQVIRLVEGSQPHNNPDSH